MPVTIIPRLILPASLLAILLWSTSCKPSPAESAYMRALRRSKEGAPSSEVIELYNEAVRLNPKLSDVRKGRGQFFFDTGHYVEALQDFEAAAENAGTGKAHILFLKGLTEGRLERYAAAEADFSEAIRLRPFADHYYAGLCLTHLSLHKPDAALVDIERAIELAPRFSRWKYVKGMVLACLGREEDAKKQFSEGVAYTAAQAGGSPKNIHFDGERELARVRACTAKELALHWDYGGRWLPEEVLAEYRK